MIAVNRKELQSALAALQPAINKKATLPILQYVNAAVDGDKLILTASRLDLWARRSVTAVHEGEPWQSVYLDFHGLTDACKNKGELVTLDQTGTGGWIVQAHIGNVDYRIWTMSIDEMPPMPAAPKRLSDVLVETALFQDVFSRIASIASTDTARPVLTAVHLCLKDRALTVEAADGFRLVRTSLPVQACTLDEGEAWEALVPASACKAIGKLTSQAVALIIQPPVKDEAIHFEPVKVDGGSLFVMGDESERLVISLIPGTYPDLNQVIPLKCAHSVSFLSDTMQTALQPLLKAFGPMRLVYGDEKITLSVESDEQTIKSACACRLDSETPPPVMAFNPGFLMNLLKVAGEDSLVKMETNIDTTPALLTAHHADPNFQAVIMPMHLG